VEQGESSYPERREIMMAQRARIQRQLRELLLALEVTEYKIEVYTRGSCCRRAAAGALAE